MPAAALQLYGLRREAARDLPATLAAVAGMGYAGVELAGAYGRAGADLRRLVADAGLAPVGLHLAAGEIAADVEAAVALAAAAGAPRLVVASFGPRPAWADAARLVARAADAAAGAGIALAVHNHAGELVERLGGRPVVEALLAAAPSAELELDVGWAHVAGVDPAAVLRRHAGRIRVVHLKDVARGGSDPVFCELGRGEVRLAGVVASAGAAGVEWLVVEQDSSADPPASAAESLAWLRRAGLASRR